MWSTRRVLAAMSFVFVCMFFAANVEGHTPAILGHEIVPTPVDGGIKEDIPAKHRQKYERWKAELLSTSIGREQWERYANNKNFVLTIKVEKGKGKGAGTDRFQWDSHGRFVGATITLGSAIEDGFPSAIYYPVLNSLGGLTTDAISGTVLAATKLSHEIGHVIQTESISMDLVRRQSELIPVYTNIFLKNGYDATDAKLIDLERKIGGTPIKVWENREYWSEVNAMRFLAERLKDEKFYCEVFDRIRNNVEQYAPEYVSRFEEPGAIACK